MLLSFELSHLNSFIEYFLINKLQMVRIAFLLHVPYIVCYFVLFGIDVPVSMKSAKNFIR